MTTIEAPADRPADRDRPAGKDRRLAFLVGDRMLPGAVTAGLWIWGALNIALVVWIGATSLKSSKDIFARPFSLPLDPQWDNFSRAWSSAGFGQAFLNTALVAVAAAVLSVVVAAPAAYALSRSRRRLSGPVTFLFALGMSIPHQALLVPYYFGNAELTELMVDWVTGWWDPRISLTLAYVVMALPFTVFVLTGYFRGLPRELEEAAALDGATGFTAFRKVMLPVSMSGLRTVLVINLIGLWNETLLVLLLIQDSEQRTLGASLLNFYGSMQYTADWAGLFAGIVIVVFPMLALYAWLSRHIVEGMTAGIGK